MEISDLINRPSIFPVMEIEPSPTPNLINPQSSQISIRLTPTLTIKIIPHQPHNIEKPVQHHHHRYDNYRINCWAIVSSPPTTKPYHHYCVQHSKSRQSRRTPVPKIAPKHQPRNSGIHYRESYSSSTSSAASSACCSNGTIASPTNLTTLVKTPNSVETSRKLFAPRQTCRPYTKLHHVNTTATPETSSPV